MSSLNALIPWNKLLDYVSNKKNLASLPTSTSCSLCKHGRLNLYQDPCQGGTWFYCNYCNSSGDMVTLAATLFKLTEALAVRQLERASVVDPIQNLDLLLDRRKRQVVNQSTRIDQLVKESRQGGKSIFNPASINLTSKLLLNIESSLSWAADGFGKLVGFSTGDRIEELLRRRADISSPKKQRYLKRRICPAESDVFLLCPYIDVPGRYVGMSLVYANSRRQLKHTYWSAQYQAYKGDYHEGGIWAHPDVISGKYSSPVIFTSDFVAALRLQARNFNKSPQPLPLAVYRQAGPSTNYWQSFFGREQIFWDCKLTPTTLSYAIKQGARVSRVGPNVGPIREYLSNREPGPLIDRVIKDARPWYTVLAQLVDELAEDSLSDWLSELDLNSEETRQVADACTIRNKSKFKQALSTRVLTKSIPDAKGYLEQRPNGWYYVRPGESEELVTTAPFKITQAIVQHDAVNKTVYKVEVNYNHKVIPFYCEKDKFQTKPFKIIQDKLIEAGAGVVAYNSRYESSAVYSALQFHAPEIVYGVTSVGYDINNNLFITPKTIFDVSNGKTKPAGPVNSVDKLPLNFEDDFNYRSQKFYYKAKKIDSIQWAAMLAITRQLLAPLAGFPSWHVSYHNIAAERACRNVIKALNLPYVEGTTSKRILSNTTQHRVPHALINSSYLSALTLGKITEQNNHSYIFSANYEQQLYGLLTETIISVRSVRSDPGKVADLSVIAAIINQVIRVAIERNKLDYVVRDVDSLIELFNRSLKIAYSKITVPSDVKKYIWWPQSALKALTATIIRLVGSGYMSIANSDKSLKCEPRVIYRLTSKELFFIPRYDLALALKDAGAPKLDITEFTLKLLDSDPPVSLSRLKGVDGWLVPDYILDDAISSFTKSHIKLSNGTA